MSQIVVGGGKIAASILIKKFGAFVVERWTRFRANHFLEAFYEQLSIEMPEDSSSEKTDELLNDILADEKKSSIMFEAYRAVSLAKSKIIGPRIIGLLTATIILRDELASSFEEDLFAAAENMSDDELLEFSVFFKKQIEAIRNGSKAVREVAGEIEIVAYDDQIDSAWDRDKTIDMSPIDLKSFYGSWALRMKNLGIISDRVEERTYEYKEDSERHIDEDGVMRLIKWIVIVPKSLELLVSLIDRSTIVAIKSDKTIGRV